MLDLLVLPVLQCPIRLFPTSLTPLLFCSVSVSLSNYRLSESEVTQHLVLFPMCSETFEQEKEMNVV